jgi:hypothetical protein
MTTDGWRNRFRTGRGVVRAVAVTATALACVGVGLQSAQADYYDDGYGDVTCGSWEESGTTNWSTDPNPPAGDTDTLRYVDQQTREVQDSPGHREFYVAGGEPSLDINDASWVETNPGAGWIQFAQDTVVDQPAWDEAVFAHWQRYSWTGGPHASDDPPAFPSSDWQPNVAGDPHGVGVEGAYYRSAGNSGNGDWFYLEAVKDTVHHEAVTHQVYRFGRFVPAVTHTEYRWVIQERECTTASPEGATPEMPTVVNGDCDDLDGSVTPPVTEGITYSIEGNIITATPDEGFALSLAGTSYQLNEGQGSASATFDLPVAQDEAACSVTPDQPEVDDNTQVNNNQGNNNKVSDNDATTSKGSTKSNEKGTRERAVPLSIDAGL